ncbi:oxygenase MpaB family protein [Pseudonocardia sp. NPDC049154]|uniref:oxygenase MpaB family protein n=1 Tax=Pseudonocardia sp. NPDC049154 TaxID=3155501 RepID=UPI0033C6958F
MLPQAEGARPHPSRFASAPERNARIARPLRLVTRSAAVDEELLDLLGRRMFARDELGARLAAAMRRPREGPERVTMAQLDRALRDGIDAVGEAPAALREFFAVVDRVPDWVDPALVERGARAFRRLGRSRDDVLLQLSLIGGYRFVGPADLLVETGGLTGSTAQRRLGETQTWVDAVCAPGGMRRDGEGWRLTVHVRAMHALVNDRFERNGRWDVARYGLPVNQSDQAATLGLFSSTVLLGVRALGRLVSRAESRAVMHLWKYVGWLIGVDEDWLFDTEREQNVFNRHVLLAQGGPTPAGAALAAALVDGTLTGHEGRFATLRGRYERARTLSMLRWFLGRESLHDLALPVTAAWAVPPIVVANLVESALVARVRPGRRWLERTGDRVAQRESRRRFAGAEARIGPLPL